MFTQHCLSVRNLKCMKGGICSHLSLLPEYKVHLLSSLTKEGNMGLRSQITCLLRVARPKKKKKGWKYWIQNHFPSSSTLKHLCFLLLFTNRSQFVDLWPFLIFFLNYSGIIYFCAFLDVFILFCKPKFPFSMLCRVSRNLEAGTGADSAETCCLLTDLLACLACFLIALQKYQSRGDSAHSELGHAT